MQLIYRRRKFLKSLGVIALIPFIPEFPDGKNRSKDRLFPPRLQAGQTCGLINPAGATFHPDDIALTEEILNALGLQAKHGPNLLNRRGYLAGTDQDRASDVNEMFADDEVNAILTVRGGWGCNRLLPYLDYELIGRNPKIIMGYSDITSLLLAIFAKTGLITFHGPVGISTWNEFTLDYVRRILFNGEKVDLINPPDDNELNVQFDNRVLTITAGRARGILVGGNLAVLSAMVGSEYLPDWKGKIMFVEEVGEDIYRVDRMLTQLKLAGILQQLNGFIFGKCTNCRPGESYGSLTLEEVLDDHIKPLRIPAWYGSMIGHIEDKFTVPIGVEVEIDSDIGQIKMLEAAVV